MWRKQINETSDEKTNITKNQRPTSKLEFRCQQEQREGGGGLVVGKHPLKEKKLIFQKIPAFFFFFSQPPKLPTYHELFSTLHYSLLHLNYILKGQSEEHDLKSMQLPLILLYFCCECHCFHLLIGYKMREPERKMIINKELIKVSP